MRRILLIVLLLSSFWVFRAPIRVGILEFAPPFSSKADNNHYYGLIIDMMDYICKMLQRECVYVATPLGGQFSYLSQGKVDITFAPSPITYDIPEQFCFSLPFMASYGQFVVLRDSSIKTLADIKNKKIGILKYTLFSAFLANEYNFDNQVIPYSQLTDLFNGFLSKQVDVVLLNYGYARYLYTTTESKFRLIGGQIPIGDGYGVLALKTNKVLIEQINHILLDMESDGVYLKIYNQYFAE